MVKFQHIRFGHAMAGHNAKRASACADPAFYKSPAWDSVMPSTQSLTVSWDTSTQYSTCLGNPSTIDIYLLSNQASSDGKVQKFTPISFATGSYAHSLDPKWWNGLPNIQVQVVITPTGTPLFSNPIGVGPLFNVTYDGVATTPSNNTNNGDPTLGGAASGSILQRGGLSNGAIAAAILIPILAVMGVVFLYIKISRAKQAQKTKRWTQQMDARMSRISGDWQSISPHGAEVALRQSGVRMSTLFAQEMTMDTRPSNLSDRPSLSIYATSGRPSGETVGTRTSRFNPTLGTGERQSRISFAADVNASRERLSTYSTGRTSRAFHQSVVPPVPAIRTTSMVDHGHGLSEDEDEGSDGDFISPQQKAGPEDIAPALRLMRTGTNPAAKSGEDLLLSPPCPPTPVLTINSPLGAGPNAPPLSPLGMMPMQPHSQYASFMSPDAMLKQYAEARASGAKSPSYPAPMSPIYSLPPLSPVPSTPTLGVPQYTATGMRNLTGDSSLSSQQQQQGGDWHY